jgi:hypothetical protein
MPAVVLLSSGSSLPAPRSRLARVLLSPARRGGVPFPFSPGASRGEGVEKIPMGLVPWRPRFACMAPFEARPRAARGDLPPVPLAVRRAGQVAPVAAARATPRVRTVWGQ